MPRASPKPMPQAADVDAAKAQVNVAEADERRTAALLAYTKVTAPYDGVITVRNANTGAIAD